MLFDYDGCLKFDAPGILSYLKYSEDMLSKSNLPETPISEIESNLTRTVLLTYLDKFAPICAPITDPIERKIVSRYSGWPKKMWTTFPTMDVISSESCDVAAAVLIVKFKTTSISGTKIIPPPIPNKLETNPAPRQPALNMRFPVLLLLVLVYPLISPFPPILFLSQRYMPVRNNIIAKYILNCSNGTIEDKMAPIAAPGMANDAIRIPRRYFIFPCFEYAIVEERDMDDTDIKLVLDIWAGLRPMNVNTGEMMMPPPTPTIAPTIPAAVPITIITKICSIK